MTTWYQRIGTSNVTDAFTWTVATRPANPATGERGYNTDFNGFEYYNGSKWMIESGTWTTATRPVTTNIAAGSQGYNSDTGYALEAWNGTDWQII